MWCDACRSVGTIHCAHPDECGNMLPDRAAAENWNAWLDDLPVGVEFQPAIERLQDFIAGIAIPILTPTTVDASQAVDPVVNAPDPAAIREAALREAAATVQVGDTVQNIQRRILALIQKGATK